MGRFQDLTGQKFNLLTVLERDYSKRRVAWKCKCDCGNYTVVTSDALKRNEVKSCGCIKYRTKHSLTKTRIYRIWVGMKQRCNNPNADSYERYGGKGIKVCEEWDNAENGSTNFIEWAYENGYSDELSIDRIDSFKGYSPSNCRWVNKEIQTLNRNVKPGKSGYVGVRQCENGNWYSGIFFKGKYIHLGTYKKIEDAVKVRKEAEEKYFNKELEKVK